MCRYVQTRVHFPRIDHIIAKLIQFNVHFGSQQCSQFPKKRVDIFSENIFVHQNDDGYHAYSQSRRRLCFTVEAIPITPRVVTADIAISVSIMFTTVCVKYWAKKIIFVLPKKKRVLQLTCKALPLDHSHGRQIDRVHCYKLDHICRP